MITLITKDNPQRGIKLNNDIKGDRAYGSNIIQPDIRMNRDQRDPILSRCVSAPNSHAHRAGSQGPLGAGNGILPTEQHLAIKRLADVSAHAHDYASVVCRVIAADVQSMSNIPPGLSLIRLEDYTGDLLAVCANGVLRSAVSAEYPNRYVLQLASLLRDEAPRYAVLYAEPLADADLAAFALPYSASPAPEVWRQLVGLWGWLTTPALRRFLGEILSDDEIVIPWVSAPASLEHHHSRPGGLIAHSLDCARRAFLLRLPSRPLWELLVVACLTHDIGKIKTLAATLQRTQLGNYVDADHLNLEVLATPLRALEARWYAGATTLRQLLAPQIDYRNGSSYPRSALRELKRQIDRESVAADLARYPRPIGGVS